ncbi:hypothetical protein Syun_003368 [Stephania yunnanensis]|uniref:DUF1279 domain-containing protein n=1 Tax=Stephania yunnanensis TaxID=152371 RepID=A0AAP0L1A8_9MAGN
MSSFTGRFKELMKKYGKVGLGVHLSVSAASITGLYVAIRNNVDVESIFDRVGVGGVPHENKGTSSSSSSSSSDETYHSEEDENKQEKRRNRTAELAASSGGALALAVLCNKALFPIRVPITIAITPPIARFLARRRIINNRV